MIYRATIDDFVVEELPRFEPSKDGAHELLLIEKRDRDTAAVAADLANLANCSRSEVGFAGRKDRIAVTRQWFSVPVGGLPEEVLIEGVQVLERARHDRRLRTGDLRGNRFRLRVREVPAHDLSVIRTRFERMCDEGFDNLFGGQRFGRDGDNADRGRRLLLGEDRLGDRRLARLLVSALQSELFNEVLERRRQEMGRIELISGDIVRHHAAGSIRWIGEPTEEDRRRFREGITSPTGPLFGAKMRWPRPPADQWEREVLRTHSLSEAQFRGRKGLKIWGDRRALRAPLIGGSFAVDRQPDDIDTHGTAETVDVVVEFSLGPGCYASVCLEQAFGPDLREASRPSPEPTADRDAPAGSAT